MAAPFPALDLDPQSHALRFMRRVRWLAVVFTLVQFWLYRPPAGVTVPFDQWPTGLALAATIAGINVLLLIVERRRNDLHDLLVLTGLFFDALIVLGVVWLFRFDTTSALWGLLVIPVLEAAVAAQMFGALSVWALLTIGYIVREFDAAARYDYAVVEAASISFRMGIVLIVATTAGSLANGLTREARAQRAARLESQQRARLLHGLALSSQVLLDAQTQSDAHAVWDAIVGAAIDIGFDSASICVVEPDRNRYIVACGRRLPEGYLGSMHALDTGLTGEVWRRGEVVAIDNYSDWAGSTTAFKGEGFLAAIGVPIRREFEVEAVLIAGARDARTIGRPERECMELLAVHAGVALNNVAHSAERDRYERRLTEIAYTDTLTGLPKRDIFLERLDAVMTSGCSKGAAVLFIDVDRFKTVNDSLGHHGGDALLTELSQRLVLAASPNLVSRHGGDEFTVLVEDVPSTADAVDVATELVVSLSQPLQIDGQEILPSVSVGVRFALPGDAPADQLLREADTAMYRAKKLGRQRIEVFDPCEAESIPRLTLEAEMRRGLDAGQFEVHYQPVVSMSDRRMISVEALLRWNHPTRGMVSPAEFIPLAEDCGFIVQLGRWVLREACLQTAAWRAAGYDLDIAVNVSVVQLQHQGLLDDITAALAASQLCPSRLILEITESTTVTDPALMLSQAQRIRSLGVRLALDDFGQGTTSLRFVRRLPLDVLKIDKSFVDDLLSDDGSAGGEQVAVVRSVIAMAHDLGLVVTAEGIEQEQQMAVLHDLGCDNAQGYLLGRPVPAAGITDALRSTQSFEHVNA